MESDTICIHAPGNDLRIPWIWMICQLFLIMRQSFIPEARLIPNVLKNAKSACTKIFATTPLFMERRLNVWTRLWKSTVQWFLKKSFTASVQKLTAFTSGFQGLLPIWITPIQKVPFTAKVRLTTKMKKAGFIPARKWRMCLKTFLQMRKSFWKVTM